MMKNIFKILIILMIVSCEENLSQVVDKTPVGINVGNLFLPDNIYFDPKTLNNLKCFAPTSDRPVYEIAIPIGDWKSGSDAYITGIKLNETPFTNGSYFLYLDGKYQNAPHDYEQLITKENREIKKIVLLVRSLWHNNQAIKAEVEITYFDIQKKIRTKEIRYIEGKAPTTGGMPEGNLHYESFALSEEAGLNRNNEPVEISVSVYPNEIATSEKNGGLSRELRLYMVAEDGKLKPIPVQIFDTVSISAAKYRRNMSSWYLFTPSKNARIFFFADVEAFKTIPYIITYGSIPRDIPPKISSELNVQRVGEGYIVSNKFYTCTLDQRSGQIWDIKFNGTENSNIPVLKNSIGRALHYNPGVMGSDGLWGQTYRWDPPDFTNIATEGPLLFRITRRGKLVGQVHASVTYNFYAETPYIGVSTVVEVKNDYEASAIRTSELLLDSHLITHYVWKSRNGKINRIPSLQRAGLLDSPTDVLDAEIPWISMTNEFDGYGIGAIWTKIGNFNTINGIVSIHRPGYMLYSHIESETPLTYFTRVWVLPFGYKGTRPNILVKSGTVYYDNGAFTLYRFTPGSDNYEEIENISAKLNYPLIIKAGN